MPIEEENLKAEYVKAEKTALKLVARAEQCSGLLSRKLQQKQYSPAVIEAVIARLAGQDLINDRRYAELWLKSKIAKGNKGPLVLKMKLLERGIDKETAEAALEAALTPETEAALLERCLEKLFLKSDLKNSDMRYMLKMQGFSADAINQYFEAIS